MAVRGPVALRLQDAPGHLLRRAQRVHTELWSHIVGSEVTGPQFSVLVVSAAQPSIDQKRLGELASLDKATCAGVVTRLVNKGLLQREINTEDRRRRVLALTDAARDRLPALHELVAQVQQQLLAPLESDDRRRFLELIARVAYSDLESDPELPDDAERMAIRATMSTIPGYLIRRAQQFHASLWMRAFDGDLTGPQYAVLAALAGVGSIDQSEIGIRASLDSSTVADVVARLGGRGWIERTPDGADRRRVNVTLSDLASTALPHITRTVETVQRELLDSLDSADDVAEFISLMRRVSRIDQELRGAVR